MTESHFCGECGEAMSLTTGTVAYPQSGLANVELHNVPVWQCKNGHQDAQIPAIDGLHLVLARAIVAQPWRLKGAEIRFLRKFFGYSAREFSRTIGLHYATLSGFENDHDPVTRPTEALIRLFFAQSLREKYNSLFPRPLIPLLEALEQGTSPGSLELERVEVDTDRISEPSEYWQEAGRP